VWKHRQKVYSGFTAKYGVSRLVWYETHGEREQAFRRERRIKKWNRAWKIRLIEAENPIWADLYEAFLGTSSPDPSKVPLSPPPPLFPEGGSSHPQSPGRSLRPVLPATRRERFSGSTRRPCGPTSRRRGGAP
jgi:predicted GIY-YIG superfamily endonuclease